MHVVLSNVSCNLLSRLHPRPTTLTAECCLFYVTRGEIQLKFRFSSNDVMLVFVQSTAVNETNVHPAVSPCWFPMHTKEIIAKN